MLYLSQLIAQNRVPESLQSYLNPYRYEFSATGNTNMTSGQTLVLVAVIGAGAIFLASKYRHWIRRVLLARLNIDPKDSNHKLNQTDQSFGGSSLEDLTEEESEAELVRLQKFIESRKKIAWNSDIAHHLWSLYQNLLPIADPKSADRYVEKRDWHDIKILQVSNREGVRYFEFELKGNKYTFVDDEESSGWSTLTKSFSLCLIDESDRCLIEIPMKMILNDLGRSYSILSGGPNAFLLGTWMNDFIHVKLKNQRIRNQEIREQRHQQRLAEIEDLKNKFGIED